MKKMMIVFISFLFIVSITSCGNVVPPGTTVIVLKAKGSPVVKNEGLYKAWGRDKVYFLDTKLKAFSKSLRILCADEINMSVDVKWLGAFKVSDESIDIIKKKIPDQAVDKDGIKGFELSLGTFFKTAMADILSSITREIIANYNTDDIRNKREIIRLSIKKRFLERMAELKYPIETADVLITNLDYPPEVTAKRKKIKEAELQDLENAALAKAAVAKAKRDAELATEQGKAKLVTAKVDAVVNNIRAKSLTPEILAVKQLEMLVQLAEGPNNSIIVIPFDAIRPGGLQETLINREAIDRLTNVNKK